MSGTMTSNARRRRRAPLHAVLLLGATGCFLPIRHTEPASPAILGELRRSDGTPASNVPIVLSTTSGGGACRHAAARTVTDSAGRFAFARTMVQRRGYLIFPAIERFGVGYQLCADTGGVALQHVFGGRTLQPSVTDTVACLAWRHDDAERFACRSRWVPRLVEGGAWDDAGARGSYRLILALEERRRRGHRRPMPIAVAYAQWVEHAGAVQRVRATLELPLSREVDHVHSVALMERDGRWHAALAATRSGRLGGTSWVQVELPLGAPGRVGPAEVRRATHADLRGGDHE